MAATTARYMGLRTYRYRPPTTRLSVGATGAGVPRPSATNRAKAWTSTIAPRMSRISPATRTGAQPASDPRTCHRVSHQGTTPATTPGATAKNSTLPTAAVSLFMPAAQAPRDSSVRDIRVLLVLRQANIQTVCMELTYQDLHTDSTHDKGFAVRR